MGTKKQRYAEKASASNAARGFAWIARIAHVHTEASSGENCCVESEPAVPAVSKK
jgi:hypothetical protein